MKVLSEIEVCKLAVVLKKVACKVTASRFADLYALLYGKPVRALLGDRWWIDLMKVPGIYAQLAKADNGAALTVFTARPADVLLWHCDAQFGAKRMKMLLGK